MNDNLLFLPTEKAQMFTAVMPIAARYEPQPDITAYELALILPYVLGRAFYEQDWNQLGVATRHFVRLEPSR